MAGIPIGKRSRVQRGASVAAGPTGGHGLQGMRERVEHLGGEFDAGSGPDAGFRVRARLPRPTTTGVLT